LSKGVVKLLLVLCIAGVLVFMGAEAYAAVKVSPARKIWDTVMLFVNFGILVFIFLKFGRKPLVDFLRNQARKIEENLRSAESELQGARAKMSSEAEKLKEIEKRIQEIRAVLIDAAERGKQEIIEQAKLEAEHMLERAEAEAAYKLAKARKELKEELIDTAISLLEQRLKKGITVEDNERLVNQFVTELKESKSHVAGNASK